MQTISVVSNFSQFPGGRYRRDGKWSGEEFREKFLVPALAAKTEITVNLDGTSGYPSSFLEEAFGGLVRHGFTEEEVKKYIHVEAGERYLNYKKLIWIYVERAKLAGAH